MSIKTTKRMVVSVAAAILTLSFVSAPVSAYQQKSFSDNFNHSYLKPDSQANWWIVNWGIGEGGEQGRTEGYTGPDSSFSIQHESSEKFARLQLTPQSVPGYYVNVDVAEERTGFPTDIVNEWAPTVDRSVVQTAIVRWSEQFNSEGTAGGVGSSGVWLWNSPYDFTSSEAYPANTAIGFSYNEAGSLGGYLNGLTANAFIENNPVFVGQVDSSVDITDWTELKTVWSVNAEGVESVEFFVNGQSIGTTELPTSLGSLSAELWHDNSHVIYDENGLNILYENPAQTQYFDVNSYSLKMVNN